MGAYGKLGIDPSCSAGGGGGGSYVKFAHT